MMHSDEFVSDLFWVSFGTTVLAVWYMHIAIGGVKALRQSAAKRIHRPFTWWLAAVTLVTFILTGGALLGFSSVLCLSVQLPLRMWTTPMKDGFVWVTNHETLANILVGMCLLAHSVIVYTFENQLVYRPIEAVRTKLKHIFKSREY